MTDAEQVWLGLAAGVAGGALVLAVLLGVACDGCRGCARERVAVSIVRRVAKAFDAGDARAGLDRTSALTGSRLGNMFMRKHAAWQEEKRALIDARNASTARSSRVALHRRRRRWPCCCGALRIFPRATLLGLAAALAFAFAAAHVLAVQLPGGAAALARGEWSPLRLRPGPNRGFLGGGWSTPLSGGNSSTHPGAATVFSRVLRNPFARRYSGSASASAGGDGTTDATIAQWNDLLFPWYALVALLLYGALHASRRGTVWRLLCCGSLCPLKRSANVLASHDVGGGATKLSIRLKKRRRCACGGGSSGGGGGGSGSSGEWARELHWQVRVFYPRLPLLHFVRILLTI